MRGYAHSPNTERERRDDEEDDDDDDEEEELIENDAQEIEVETKRM